MPDYTDHGHRHGPGGTDPALFGWNDPETSAAVGLAKTIQFGTGLTVTDEGGGVIRVDTDRALPFNLGELGSSGSGTLADTHTMTISFQDMRPGDGILVAALAPSKSSSGASIGDPVDCADSQGNFYNSSTHRAYEASPPNVNEGFYVQLFRCDAPDVPLVVGDTITVTWLNPVYDRQVYAWAVRHQDGPSVRLLASTAENDATSYAASQITLQSPAWTPGRDNALELALVMAAKAGGLGGFGGPSGFSGFYQAKFHQFTGSKQTYLLNCQTHGADSYMVANDAIVPYEIDLGALPGGVPIAAFNGCGQTYTSGTNAYKGIILLALE